MELFWACGHASNKIITLQTPRKHPQPGANKAILQNKVSHLGERVRIITKSRGDAHMVTGTPAIVTKQSICLTMQRAEKIMGPH